MTLSNFDWTDKQTVRWFIMQPGGHEGPYSLEQLSLRLQQGKISSKTQVWAEGLPNFVSLETVLFPKTTEAPVPKIEELPPLPVTETNYASLREEPDDNQQITEIIESRWWKKPPILIGVLCAVFVLGIRQWVVSSQDFSIRRHPKMSPELYHKILRDFQFESWSKDIFFKEYISTDLSHIWLVTSSFQHCDVEASFYSIPGKLLTLNKEKVAMKSKGKLDGHVVEFSNFEFTSGSKIVPGLYELDIKAANCKWDGLKVKIANNFSEPDDTYVARTKVVLYPQGALTFNKLLEKLVSKKTVLERKLEAEEEFFWQDLQQKLQTLLAVTLQIEQHFIDFLSSSGDLAKNVKPMVDDYTKKYGPLLTNFVVANTNYFKEMNNPELKNLSIKKNYEPMVRMAAKNIGLETMKIIEQLQTMKTIKKPQMENLSKEVKGTYKKLKDDLNRKIIQVSEDRSH